MATERLQVRKTREILRLKLVSGLSHRETARSLGISAGAVGKTMSRAKKAGLSWVEVSEMSELELETRLYGAPRAATHGRVKPDPAAMHLELKRPGVTLELLHLEYLAEHPGGYGYTVFCDTYREWLKRRSLTMRHNHKAGDKMFVDYSGKRPSVVNAETGEFEPVELFVATLGASSYTYAEATRTQTSKDFIASHVRALEFFGGVPTVLVPDQLKSGVVSACRYEPIAQRTYEEMARHYGSAILPARPRKPRDKAKVEVAVQVVQRWILARLRNRVFYTLEALNEAIAELLVDLNARPMKHLGKSRCELFEEIDSPALAPLPAKRFVHATWKSAKVNIDYHVEFDKHFYSAPFSLSREVIELRATFSTVEIFHRGKRVASHQRSFARGKFTTKPEHMPRAHRKHLEWTPSRLIRWGQSIGVHTGVLVEKILESKPHPEMGYRSCLGILRLAKQYGPDRLEAACARGNAIGARSYRQIASILKHNLDRVALETPDDEEPIEHENVRGPDYYH